MAGQRITQYQVAIAAEAFAACVLAHAGCDVAIQYGANQPGYDLIATRGGCFRKVSVKGSQDGGWGLIQSYKRGRTYAEAAESWCAKQKPDVVFCLVQFEGTVIGGAPRIYFAWPAEIAAHLKVCRSGHGHTILYEDYTMVRGVGAGFCNKLPVSWAASRERIDSLFR